MALGTAARMRAAASASPHTSTSIVKPMQQVRGHSWRRPQLAQVGFGLRGVRGVNGADCAPHQRD